ncbi:Thimet oligopeptidase [Acidisarcina polymorpha]|uniref:Thimet oligopeptidase n=1 Tax=Acidisarcina polymorpha TaxID=2211140 RepID=A0A2Z5FVC3_9BACT|nr:M3 family metallopeptidase [Acidisarcina polymorpha]AXC10702.1 Thimet oligopeptidase [Acidisarcina polymorpha]
MSVEIAERREAALAEGAVSHAWMEKADAASVKAWVDARLDQYQASIDKLVSVPGHRTIENTLRPFDDAQAVLAIAGQQASLLDSVHPDKAVRDVAQAATQKISAAATALSLNQEVYNALSAIDITPADAATRHYVERTLLQYRLSGVDRDEATRSRIKELQDKATEISLAFSRNVQEGAQHIQVTEAELAGLPDDYLKAHPAGEDGLITLSTDFPDMQPLMTYCRNAEARRRMFLAYQTRAYPLNKELLLDLLKVRQELATILGYKTWADLATADQMMQSAERMQAFLDELEEASRSGAEREYAMVLGFAKQQEAGLEEIDLAARGYWYEQFRRSAFQFDSQSVRPYFPYAQVEQGILATAEKLFQVRFEQVEDADVWDPSVSAWRVFDADKEIAADRDGERQIGLFYLDMHPREGKDKWFSAAPLVPGVRDRQFPEAALICNFPGGKEGDPGLMQYSDVVTYFHEFGHLMHAILGGHQEWAGISGIRTEWDFVEAPSQMLEEFFRDPKLLATFAHHYESGEALPAEIVQRMNHASAFGRADSIRTQLVYTSYSLDTHNVDPEKIDLDRLLQAEYKRFSPYAWIEGNRMYASFGHLIGYSSNYYTYLFDKAIALDFFNQFDRENLLEGPAGLRYRQTVLEPGGARPARELVQEFLGRQQSLEAFKAWISEEFASPAS